jgi:hypothetical protein
LVVGLGIDASAVAIIFAMFVPSPIAVACHVRHPRDVLLHGLLSRGLRIASDTEPNLVAS